MLTITKKPHRYASGTVSLREVVRYRDLREALRVEIKSLKDEQDNDEAVIATKKRRIEERKTKLQVLSVALEAYSA